MKKKEKDELLDEIVLDAIVQEQSFVDVINCPSEDFVRLRPEKPQLPVVVEKKELIHSDNDLDKDAKYIRENLHQVIEQNQIAIKDLLTFSTQSQSPRSYEVLAQLIRTLNESNNSLLELHRTKTKIENTPNNETSGPKNVTNTAIFLGSTNDLDEMLTDALKKAIPIETKTK